MIHNVIYIIYNLIHVINNFANERFLLKKKKEAFLPEICISNLGNIVLTFVLKSINNLRNVILTLVIKSLII